MTPADNAGGKQDSTNVRKGAQKLVLRSQPKK
jgi:hypothetical protein